MERGGLILTIPLLLFGNIPQKFRNSNRDYGCDVLLTASYTLRANARKSRKLHRKPECRRIFEGSDQVRRGVGEFEISRGTRGQMMIAKIDSKIEKVACQTYSPGTTHALVAP